MRKYWLFALAMISAAAVAETAPGAGEFDEAWRAYQAAVEADDSKATVATAKRTVELGEQLLPAGDPRIAALNANYGAALLAARRRDDAQPILKRALEQAVAAYGEDSVETIPYLENLADAVAEPGRTAEQGRYYRKALDIAGEHFGEDSLEYADGALRAGISYVARSQKPNGKRFLYDAMEIYQASPDADPGRIAQAAFWLGKVNVAQGRHNHAEEQFLLALDGFSRAGTPMTHYELTTRAHLVNLYESRGMSEKATKHCLAIGAARPDRVNADLEPVFRMAPKFPTNELRNNNEGSVEFSLTVDEQGFVRNPTVVAREGGDAFERAALEVVERFRYAPKFVDGQPVAVEGVKTKITFRIE